MHGRVQYPETIEPLVQFIEETPPGEILDRTLEKLRAGVAAKTMLTASALAVIRSADLPPGHHGGPLHPLAGLHAITKLVGRLEGEERFLPVLQHVALSNKHINDPVTWPFSLLEFAPLDPTAPTSAGRPIWPMTARRDRHGGRRGDQGGLPEGVQPRREQQGGPHLPVAVGHMSRAIEAFDLLMSVAHPEECARRPLLPVPRLPVARAWRPLGDRASSRC